MSNTKTVEKEIKILPLTKDYYIPVSLGYSNYMHAGTPCDTKESAMAYMSGKDKKIIVKITIGVKDFEEKTN